MAERNHAGQQRYMLRSYVPNRQANGEVAGIFVLIQDITDRRRTAEALHQAYQNLEQRVRERTAELTSLNDQLLREIDERSHAEARLHLLIGQDHHRIVIEAIRTRQGARAEAIMREHARLSQHNLSRAMQTRGALDRIPGASLIRQPDPAA